jgi:hypothetical protein
LAQSITFPTLNQRYFNDSGTPLLAKASSGLAVSYTTSTPSLCQILSLGNNVFTVQPTYPLSGADNVVCRIAANQSGNSQYASALEVSQTLTFNKQITKINYRTSASTISEAGIYLYASSTTTVGRIAGSTTMVVMNSLTPTVCTVGDLAIYDTTNGPRATVRAKANGTCSIKIDYPGNADQLSSTLTWTSTVSGITTPVVGSNTPQSISFPAVADRSYSKSAPLLAVATSKLPVKYTSITPNTCYIIEKLADGPVVQSMQPTGADQVLCTIEANQSGDDRYVAASPVRVSFNYSKAPMKITATSAPTALRGAGPYTFITSVLHTETEMNSGLSSLGHLLDVSSNTPDICRIDSNSPYDRPGGIFNRTQVTALNNGNCAIRFYFAGTASRAPTTLTWTGVSSGFVIPTSTYIELQSLQKPIPATGSTMSLKGIDAGRISINAFVKTPDPKLMAGLPSLNAMVSVANQTPTICKVENVTNTMGSSAPYTGTDIRPLKVGTCTIKYTFAGNVSMKQDGSTFTWTALVS